MLPILYSHEVRNPLSAALCASVFVNTAVQSEITDDTLESLREDSFIISSSLRFINDLLRSMLDVNRATKDQMELEQDKIDILHDIFQPVSSMIYSRDTNFVVTFDCPRGLVVKGDRLRLQQVILNLARNSAKFVVEGFVRLRAEVIEGHVHLFVEDSGPGIPEDKRSDLFNKYQKSLDSLAQGTGVGLSLVEKLVDIMDGHIWLDEAFRSGYKNYPGARLVIDLKKKPEEISEDFSPNIVDLQDIHCSIPEELDKKLPQSLNVLIVDDDRNLRKLSRRMIKMVRPLWNIQEAATGESCLQICCEEKEEFDLIFMDQYMTSVEHSMKGTETVRALRSRGIKSVICGLSANNLDSVFEGAGADHFHLKPFPDDATRLCQLLVKVLGKRSVVVEKSCRSQAESTVSETSCTLEGDATNGELLVRSIDLTVTQGSEDTSEPGLPPNLSVLFVDDDKTLRRLATRAIKKLLPGAYVREATGGESALLLTETETFDVIFMDQYMASDNESLLGTETVQKMRGRGVNSLIVGLSANQNEQAFLDAGSDHFLLKPIPCSAPALRETLLAILAKRECNGPLEVQV